MTALQTTPGLEVINLEAILRLKIKRNEWLLVSASSQSLRVIMSLRMNSSFITARPGLFFACGKLGYWKNAPECTVSGSNNM